MLHAQRLAALGSLLAESGDLWRPQPFREARPDWCRHYPALTAELLALSDEACTQLTDDGEAARRQLGRHLRVLAELQPLTALPTAASRLLPALGAFWDWEIPGRKRAQIEAFAAAVPATGRPVFDWCGGKGHLARLLALAWQVPASTLEINTQLCADGQQLAERAGVVQRFITADALQAETPLPDDAHLVALHACGGLHRQLLRRAVAQGAPAIDVAPCCYYHGVDADYTPLSGATGLHLQRDDLRLAVTETVTAAPRIARRSARERAWKLAFVALREHLTGASYRTFKPVPRAWMNGLFEAFCRQMAEREGLVLPAGLDWEALEARGRQREREVQRLSLVRHTFRRPLELWLLCDMAVFLEQAGYTVTLSEFCPRQLTPRNVLISARK